MMAQVQRPKKSIYARVADPKDPRSSSVVVAVPGADHDARIRTQVVRPVASVIVRVDLGLGHDRALGVRRVVVARARKRGVAPVNVDLAFGMQEAEVTAGNDRDGVLVVVDALEVRDLSSE